MGEVDVLDVVCRGVGVAAAWWFCVYFLEHIDYVFPVIVTFIVSGRPMCCAFMVMFQWTLYTIHNTTKKMENVTRGQVVVDGANTLDRLDFVTTINGGDPGTPNITLTEDESAYPAILQTHLERKDGLHQRSWCYDLATLARIMKHNQEKDKHRELVYCYFLSMVQNNLLPLPGAVIIIEPQHNALDEPSQELQDNLVTFYNALNIHVFFVQSGVSDYKWAYNAARARLYEPPEYDNDTLKTALWTLMGIDIDDADAVKDKSA